MISAKACLLACIAVVVLACDGGSGTPTATAEAKPSETGSGAPATPAGKDAECSALISVVNGGLAALQESQKQAKSDPDPSAELLAMASAMDKAALATGKLTLATPELKAFAVRYETMAKAVATQATAVADAAAKKDLQKVQEARKSLGETLALEDPLIDELNGFCK